MAVAGIAAYGAAYPRAQLFGRTVCRTNSPRKLALTFDDGPNPAITPKLLDLLDSYNAKATFFLIGRYVRECPELVQETVARGHLIGNHTEMHPNLLRLSRREIRIELRLCHDAIKSVIGTPPQWFRPPYGLRNPWVIPAASELGYRTVMWTLIPGDWREKPLEWLIERMNPIAEHARKRKADPSASSRGGPWDEGRDDKKGAAPAGTGDVLCLHDGGHRDLNADRSRTLAALEHWMPRWRDLGLEFVTIGEAVNAPAP